MKKLLTLVFLVSIISCKNDKKETKTPESIITEVESGTEDTLESSYPKLNDAPESLNYIFDNGFEFSEDIKINYIALQSKGGDNYQLIYSLTDDSDLARIESLKVSAVFYPEDASLFKDELYRKRKSRQVPMAVKISNFEGEAVISQEFTILPKKHNQVKFYFYSDKGVENDRILTVRNIDLPK